MVRLSAAACMAGLENSRLTCAPTIRRCLLGAGETSLTHQHTSTLVSQLVAAHEYTGQVLWFAAVKVRPGRDKNRGLMLVHDHVVFSQDLEHCLTFVTYHTRRLSCSMEVQVETPSVQHIMPVSLRPTHALYQQAYAMDWL